MSIHVCKCEHNGRTEYHLRYPDWTDEEAQSVADKINGGALSVQSPLARGIDSGEAGETRSGSTPKGQEPGCEATRPEESRAQPSPHIEPVMFDNGVPTGWVSECPFCLRTLHFERKSPPQKRTNKCPT